MPRLAPFALAAGLALSPLAVLAQAPAAAPAPATATAYAADVASVDAILAALYDVISGPAGQPRDWNRLRALFTPEARMMAVGRRDGAIVARAMTVEDYITRNTPAFAKSGFFEREVGRSVDQFGQIAQVFSTYEARHASADAAPFARGINSIQLYHDGQRWWIVSLLWRAEDDSLPLPARYLRVG